MPTAVLQGHQEKSGLAELLRLFYGSSHETDHGLLGGEQSSPEIISRLTVLSDTRVLVETVCGASVRSRLVEQGMEGHRPHPLARREIKRQFYQILAELTGQRFPYGSLTGVRPTRLAQEALAKGHSPQTAEDLLVNDYAVSPTKAALLVDTAGREQTVLSTIPEGDALVYLHVPICPTRCSYCSFTCAVSGGRNVDLKAYVEAMVHEASALSPHMRRPIDSVYVGGGTPTVLPADLLHRLLSEVLARLPLRQHAEITVEAGRPDTIDPEKLAVIRDVGASRISINPQTLHDRTLTLIGRHHTALETRNAFLEARKAGFDRINCDLIAGLPQETPQDFLSSLNQLIEWSPENITIHTLAFKRKSELTRMVDRSVSRFDAPDWSDALDEAHAKLAEHGLVPYYLYRQKDMVGGLENTGYARPGSECRYNVGMMSDSRPVYGMGAGAMSKYVDEAGWLRRLSSPKDLKSYYQSLDQSIENKIRTLFP